MLLLWLVLLPLLLPVSGTNFASIKCTFTDGYSPADKNSAILLMCCLLFVVICVTVLVVVAAVRTCVVAVCV